MVGVNTAIVTTSGSNAGIGFAVPSDQVKPAVSDIIRKDQRTSRGRVQARLGVSIVNPCGAGVATATDSQKSTNTTAPTTQLTSKCWVTSVQPKSPAEVAGFKSIKIRDDEACTIQYGDAIIAIGGNVIHSYKDLQRELDQRYPGERLAVTLQDGETGEKRVVYLILDRWQ